MGENVKLLVLQQVAHIFTAVFRNDNIPRATP